MFSVTIKDEILSKQGCHFTLKNLKLKKVEKTWNFEQKTYKF